MRDSKGSCHELSAHDALEAHIDSGKECGYGKQGSSRNMLLERNVTAEMYRNVCGSLKKITISRSYQR
jgi:hypothetical protein